jgi:hypothetical protein
MAVNQAKVLLFRVADGQIASVQVQLPLQFFGAVGLHLHQAVLHKRPVGNAPRALEKQEGITADVAFPKVQQLLPLIQFFGTPENFIR